MSMQDATQSAPIPVSGTATADDCYRLGLMYAAGRSVPVDRVRAHAFLSLAAAGGLAQAAVHRRELSAEMTRDEITEAQRQARSLQSFH